MVTLTGVVVPVAPFDQFVKCQRLTPATMSTSPKAATLTTVHSL